VAINGGTNAGILAARILGAFNNKLSLSVQEYAASLEAQVNAKVEKMATVGWDEYKT
jgi:phosphoribosylaminoimidazole carboxylase